MNERNLFSENTGDVVSSERILYTPSAFAKSSLLHLQEIGRLKALKAHRSSRSGLQSYLFILVDSGAGELEYAGKTYKLTKGACVFIDCNRAYTHFTDSSNLWTLRWCHFYGMNLPAIYEKYCERGGWPVFYPRDCKKVGKTWEELYKVASGSDYMRDMLINQELSNLLTLLMAESWHPQDKEKLPRKKAITASVKEYLDINYAKKVSLDNLADQFYINKFYLSKSFKERYGVSVNNYLLSIRITKAKQLLRFSDKKIEEIGFECGLGAAHYFSSKFKEIEGVSPSVYREQW